MFNVKIIEKLASIEGDNLISFYLNFDRSQFSGMALINKIKDMLKSLEINEDAKEDFKNKLQQFLNKVDKSNKSVAVFYGKNEFYPYVFSTELEDSISVDSFFNLEPLLVMLSENKNVGVMLVNSEEARFFSIFLGHLEAHRHIEDRIIRKHNNGGWSQARFERKIDGEIKEHLKNCVNFIIKMDKIYNFNGIFLRNDPQLENQLKSLMPKNIQAKILGDISVDFEAPADKVIALVDELTRKEVVKNENQEINEIESIFNSPFRNTKLSIGLIPTARALYDNKLQKIIVNENFIEPGFHCHFCGYIAVSEEYCPYDLTPNNRVKNLVSALLDEAIKKHVKVEVFKNDPTLSKMDNVVGLMRE